jgi:hypothetical protein
MIILEMSMQFNTKILRKFIIFSIISSRRNFPSSVFVLPSESCLPDTGHCSQNPSKGKEKSQVRHTFSMFKRKVGEDMSPLSFLRALSLENLSLSKLPQPL